MENKLKNFFKNHIGIIIIIIALVILDTLVIFYQPELPGLPLIEGTFFLFGLSLQSVFFIYCIGIFLMYRWIKTKRKNSSTLLWSLAFLFYGVVFLGLLFQSFGFPWANSNDPILFFLYRNVMIIWVVLMYIGIVKILTKSRVIQYIPAVIMGGFSYFIFVYGLVFLQDVEFTMYIFLYTFWTPLCTIIAYSFYLHGKQMKLFSPKIISIGFALLGITYLAWAPWHFGPVIYIYFIWFFIFNISLSIILIGYIILPYEIEVKSV